MNDDAAAVMKTLDAYLIGQTHLFCALADALELSGGPSKADLAKAIRSKIEWLERANVDLPTAVPLLFAEEYLTDPPRNPRDPYKEHPQLPRLVNPDP